MYGSVLNVNALHTHPPAETWNVQNVGALQMSKTSESGEIWRDLMGYGGIWWELVGSGGSWYSLKQVSIRLCMAKGHSRGRVPKSHPRFP